MAKEEKTADQKLLRFGVGDKVNTPDGIGTVESADDGLVSGKLKSGKNFSFKPRFVKLA